MVKKPLCEHSFPGRLVRGKLTLFIEHPSIKQWIQVEEEEIKRKIYRELGILIKKIRFEIRELSSLKEDDVLSSKKEVSKEKENPLWKEFLQKIRDL